MSNIKRIPLALMLAAGAISGILAYVRDYSLIHFLWLLVLSLVFFYTVGEILARVILRYERLNREAEERAKEEAKKEEGAVIEKEAAPDDVHMTSVNEQNTQTDTATLSDEKAAKKVENA